MVTLWNDLATDSKQNICAPLQQPVVMAISSCYIKRYAEGIQLSSTPATHVYLNPNLPETKQIHDVYNELLGHMEPLQIQPQIDQNLEGEQVTSKMCIQEILAVNPETHKNMRFTVDAVLLGIDNTNRWFYNKCNECRKHLDEQSPHWQCHETRAQAVPNYGYCFKAILQDDTGSTIATCFSPQADKWTVNCSQVLDETPDKDPYVVPAALTSLENTRKLFGLHPGSGSKKRKPKFVVHSAHNIEPLLLPAPSANTIDIAPASIIPESPQQIDHPQTADEMSTPPPETSDTNQKQN